MTGVELAVGWLTAYLWNKARRVADTEVDGAVELGMRRLHELVRAKLAGDPALERLEQEATQAPEAGDRTRQRVALALEDAAESDPVFAGRFAAAVELLRAAGAPEVTVSGTGPAIASGGAVANTGVVLGDVSIGGSSRTPR